MHALWGLMEHYPPGEGRLRLPERPDWHGLLPLLDRIPARVPVPGRLRRALLNRAQRLIRAHSEVVTSRPTGAILAVLLGRTAIRSPVDGASSLE
jgi:hypothetical protein